MALHYDISKLAEGRRKGTSVKLPEIHGGIGAERSYLAALRLMLRKLAEAVNRDLLPVVEKELKAYERRRAVADAMDEKPFERLRALMLGLAKIATSTSMRILGLESHRHSRAFMKIAKQTLGIDLSAVVKNEDLGDLLAVTATRNAALIRGIGEDVVKRVQLTVTNGVIAGETAAELRAKLAKDFGFADKRAKVIARDQTAKFNSDMNRIRHEQAGIEKYEWLTSRDERVRPRHMMLHGRIYKYGEPTGAEEGRPPGQPIMCRCVARAIVEFK